MANTAFKLLLKNSYTPTEKKIFIYILLKIFFYYRTTNHISFSPSSHCLRTNIAELQIFYTHSTYCAEYIIINKYLFYLFFAQVISIYIYFFVQYKKRKKFFFIPSHFFFSSATRVTFFIIPSHNIAIWKFNYVTIQINI